MPKPKAEALGDTLEFMRLLWSVNHGLQSASKEMEAVLGVTGQQRLVLRLVGRFPGLSAGELADLLHITPGTLTGILQRLEKRGYLHRDQAPEDNRRYVLTLTAAGRKIDGQRSGTVEARVREALRGAETRDVDATRRILMRLARALGVEEE